MLENPSRLEPDAVETAKATLCDIESVSHADQSVGQIISASAPSQRDLSRLRAAYRDTAKGVRAKCRHLYELPVVEYADGSRSFHEGRLYRRHGLNVMFLRGTYAEMAFQHGRLLGKEIPLGALPQTSKLVSSEVANALGGRSKFKDACIDWVQRFLIRRMFKSSDRTTSRYCHDHHSLVEIVAMSEATGMAMEDIVLSLLNPELLMILSTIQNSNLARLCGIAASIVAPLSCSSLAAWGSTTVGGDLIIGHNMDYPLNGYFDRFPTVIYFEPPAPALRFMTFMSAGLHTAGVTSYNEAGVFLATHIAPTKNVSFQGVPSIIGGDSVIRRATDFDSAEHLLRQLRPSAGWSYLLASVREGRIGSFEASSGKVALRPAVGEYHVQTNHYVTPEMRDLNLTINRSVDEDSAARYTRINQRVNEAAGRLDVNEVISILGDQVDPSVNEVRGLGNTVGVHLTMSSIVMDPARNRVLVATGSAPASHTDFVELPLVGTFDRDDFARRQCAVIGGGSFRASHSEKASAQQTFIRAKVAYEMKNDPAMAYQLLAEVVQQDPSNPAYFFQLGIFALKMEKYEDAIAAFNSMFGCPYLTEQLRRLAHYYRGRTYAHLAKGEKALPDLSVVVNDPRTDTKLLTAARRTVRWVRILGRRKLTNQSLAIMMQQSDMLSY